MKFTSSDNKIVTRYIKLPKYDLKGVDLFNKVVNHELAHWKAITGNWRADGNWYQEFGDRRSDSLLVRTLTAESNKDWMLVAKEVTNKSDAAPKYEITLTVGKTTISVARGWLKDGKYSGKTFEGGFTFVSEHAGASVPEYPSKNGIIIVRKGLTWTVYERANDPDHDYLPNLIEDQIGTDWTKFITFENFYYEKNPNDQEFWAEWSTADWTPPDCATGKDWSNPGKQTK